MLVDQGNEPYNKSMSLGCTLKILEFIQHAMKENLLLRKYFPDIFRTTLGWYEWYTIRMNQ